MAEVQEQELRPSDTPYVARGLVTALPLKAPTGVPSVVHEEKETVEGLTRTS